MDGNTVKVELFTPVSIEHNYTIFPQKSQQPFPHSPSSFGQAVSIIRLLL